jgi:threonine dehydratase
MLWSMRRISPRLDGLHLVASFDGALVAGVASYALELFRGTPELDAVYVPVGGVIAVRDALGLRTEVVGVVAASAPAYALSYAAGRPVEHAVAATIADGMACRTPNPEALDVICKGAARIVSVGEEEIRDAMRILFSDTHNAAEGAGAAAMAGLLQDGDRIRGRRAAVILSGGNVDREVFAKILAGS